MSKVDFFKKDLRVGDYFVQANHSGRSSAILKVGRVTGWKKDRMFFITGYDDWRCTHNYTTRYEAIVIIPEDLISYDLKLKMEPEWLRYSKEIADAK